MYHRTSSLNIKLSEIKDIITEIINDICTRFPDPNESIEVIKKLTQFEQTYEAYMESKDKKKQISPSEFRMIYLEVIRDVNGKYMVSIRNYLRIVIRKLLNEDEGLVL